MKEDEEASEVEEEKKTFTENLVLCCCYTVKFRFLKGASTLNLVDFVMNVLCFLSIIFKLIYSNYVNTFMKSALEKDEWIEFYRPLLLFDVVNNIDSFLYMLMAVSFIKTLVFW